MEREGSNERRVEESTWFIALKILRYLAENPNAADTAEGILQWWLLERAIIEEGEALSRALDRLVERDLIVAVETADARRHYHLNAQQTDEIRRLINEAKPRAAR